MPDINAVIKELEEKGTIDGASEITYLSLNGAITDANMHRFFSAAAKNNIRFYSSLSFDRDNLQLFPNLMNVKVGHFVQLVEYCSNFSNLILIDAIVCRCYAQSFRLAFLVPVINAIQNVTAQAPLLFGEDYKLEDLRRSLQQHIAIICSIVWDDSDRKNWEDNIIAVHFKELIESDPIPAELIAAISKVTCGLPLPLAVSTALERDKEWLQYILPYAKGHIATFVAEEYTQMLYKHLQEHLLSNVFRNRVQLLLQRSQFQALKDWCEWISAANHKGVAQEILIDNFLPELFSLYLAAYRRESVVENKAKLLQQIFKCAAHRLNSLSLPVSPYGSENIKALLKNNLGEQYPIYANLFDPLPEFPIDPVCIVDGSMYEKGFVPERFKRLARFQDKTPVVVANKAMAELLDKILCSETTVDLKQCLHILINPKIPISSAGNIADTFFQYPYLACNGETVENDGTNEVFCSNEPIKKLIGWVKRFQDLETEKPQQAEHKEYSSRQLRPY